jgi:N-acetylglucosamine kinase-like BadF-type ATPase
VDGGATKTEAALWSPANSIVVTFSTGSSNPDAVGMPAAQAAIIAAVNGAVTRAAADSNDITIAVAAIAGVDTISEQESVRDALRDVVPPAKVVVLNDVVAAWAAGTLAQPGLTAIAGTGSNVFGVGRRRDTWRCGGWGHVLGDEGSAYSIGLEGMRAAVAYRDGRAPWSDLIPRILNRYDLDSIEALSPRVYGDLDKAGIAEASADVAAAADAGDTVAAAILRTAVDQLAFQIEVTTQRLDLGAEPFPIGLSGGVFRIGPSFVSPLLTRLGQTTPKAHVRFAPIRPVGGSLLLALRLLGLESPAFVAQLTKYFSSEIGVER